VLEFISQVRRWCCSCLMYVDDCPSSIMARLEISRGWESLGRDSLVRPCDSSSVRVRRSRAQVRKLFLDFRFQYSTIRFLNTNDKLPTWKTSTFKAPKAGSTDTSVKVICSELSHTRKVPTPLFPPLTLSQCQHDNKTTASQATLATQRRFYNPPNSPGPQSDLPRK
jgi:hypothetical protein